MRAEKTSDKSSSLAHKLTAMKIDPLQVLIDAGLDPHTEDLKLDMQIKVASHAQKGAPPLSHELDESQIEKRQKELIASKWAAIDTVNEWLKKMVLIQPAIVLQATLIWLGHNHIKQRNIAGNGEYSDWLLFYSNNKEIYLTSSETSIDLKSTQNRLLACLNEHPGVTIKALLFASRFHEISFSSKELYNSPERLEQFFYKHIFNWNKITNQKNDLEIIINFSNYIYLTNVNQRKSQALSMLIKALEYRSHAAIYELEKLDNLLQAWQKIIGLDISFFSNYKKTYTLNIGAIVICGV